MRYVDVEPSRVGGYPGAAGGRGAFAWPPEGHLWARKRRFAVKVGGAVMHNSLDSVLRTALPRSSFRIGRPDRPAIWEMSVKKTGLAPSRSARECRTSRRLPVLRIRVVTGLQDQTAPLPMGHTRQRKRGLGPAFQTDDAKVAKSA